MTTLVTAASSNHYKSVKQFLRSIPQVLFFPVDIFFYDIGLTDKEASDLQLEFPALFYRKLDFTQLPEFAQLTAPCAGAYAWKPYIFNEMYEEIKDGVLIWCDAGNKMMNLPALCDVIKKAGIYSPQSSYSVQELCHSDCLQLMRVPQQFWNMPMRNAALIGVVCGDPIVKLFISDWKERAMRKELSIPETSTRKNHRWDQSILTCLMYNYGIWCTYDLVGCLIHQDCD